MLVIIGSSKTNIVEQIHLYELIGTASQTDMQKIRLIGVFFEYWLRWQFDVRLLLFTVRTCV